jgi:hypothetical protein
MPTKRGYRKIRALIAITLGALTTNVAAEHIPLNWCGVTDPSTGKLTQEALRCAEREKGGSGDREIPTYDVDARCESIFGQHGSGLQHKCVRDEQNSYDMLKGIWHDLSAWSQGICLHNAEPLRVSPRDYSYYHFLGACAMERYMAEETQRRGKGPVPKFER